MSGFIALKNVRALGKNYGDIWNGSSLADSGRFGRMIAWQGIGG